MSGHSKWATIKRKKGALDTKRGKIFTKLVKEISIAARLGGSNPEANPRLRLGIQNAKAQSMPKDNIDRAIKKGSGADAENYTELTYEGNLGTVGIFIEAATDNTNRTVANVRSYFNKAGGSLGTSGSLSFIFSRKGVFSVLIGTKDADELTLELIDAGAEDVEFDAEQMIITAPLESFGDIQKKVESLGLEIQEASLQRIAQTHVSLDADQLQKTLKLIDTLEEDDDIQKVYHNIELSQEQWENM